MGDAGAAGRGIGDEGWVIVCAIPRLNVLKRDLPVLGACGIRGFGGVGARSRKGSTPVLATEDCDRVSIDMVLSWFSCTYTHFLLRNKESGQLFMVWKCLERKIEQADSQHA